MPRRDSVNGVLQPFYSAAEETARDAEETASIELTGDIKRREAVAHMDRILHSSCAGPFGPLRNVRLDKVNRDYLQAVSMQVGSLTAQSINPATIFPQRIEVVRTDSGKSACVACTLAEWYLLTEDIFEFSDACKNALETIIARINALGTDYVSIAAIDVINYPGTQGAAWPPFYED